MKFYFGQVPDSDIDDFDIYELFEQNGNYYYYCVEFGTNPGGTDEIALYDTCGRMVPISVEHLGELAAIAVECNNIAGEIQRAEQTLEDLYSDVSAEVNGWNSINYN